jgi:hypothetical protein
MIENSIRVPDQLPLPPKGDLKVVGNSQSLLLRAFRCGGASVDIVGYQFIVEH